MKRTFLIDIEYPDCDSFVSGEEYLKELLVGDLVGDDIGRWKVDVSEISGDYNECLKKSTERLYQDLVYDKV